MPAATGKMSQTSRKSAGRPGRQCTSARNRALIRRLPTKVSSQSAQSSSRSWAHASAASDTLTASMAAIATKVRSRAATAACRADSVPTMILAIDPRIGGRTAGTSKKAATEGATRTMRSETAPPMAKLQ